MEVYGNVDALRKAIEKKYSSMVQSIEKDRKQQIDIMLQEAKEKISLLKAHMKTETDSEAKKTSSMALSAAMLSAKKDFEEKREALIESVFGKAAAKSKDIAHSKEYVDFVKKSLGSLKNLSAIGDSDYYKKDFPSIKIDKKITGLKFEAEGVVYDFTLDSMIASKRDILRHEVSKILFD